MYEVNNEKLDELSIFALRDLARRTGVSSPTSKKKDELIQQIIEIREGKREPKNRTKQGRPPKCYSYDRLNEFGSVDPSARSIVFSQDRPTFECSEDDTVNGYIEVFADGSASLSVNGRFDIVYYLASGLAERYGLKTGDRVIAQLGEDFGRSIISDIYTVNGLPIAKGIDRNNFYDIPHDVSGVELKFNREYEDFRVSRGDNVFMYGANYSLNMSTMLDVAKNVKNAVRIYINISLTEKTKFKVTAIEDVSKFVANITDSNDYVSRVVRLAVEYAKRSFEVGDDVVIVVDDALSIAGIEFDGMSAMKEILSMTKDTVGQGSITVLSLMTGDGALKWADKLADKKYVIDETGIHAIV